MNDGSQATLREHLSDCLFPGSGKTSAGILITLHCLYQESKRLEKLLSNSLNVWEWDEKGLYRYCMEHANTSCLELPADEKLKSACTTCGNPAVWIY